MVCLVLRPKLKRAIMVLCAQTAQVGPQKGSDLWVELGFLGEV